ncbi:hypothetical protein [Thalassospira mesophila]|nr:hypothetical protein [Thalassospira mesophila]
MMSPKVLEMFEFVRLSQMLLRQARCAVRSLIETFAILCDISARMDMSGSGLVLALDAGWMNFERNFG